MRYLIYDHECNFCCSIVRKLTLLINSGITYIPLKSPKGKWLINCYHLHDVNSVIYINDKDEIYIKSIAILHLSRKMRFPYRLISLFKILPSSFLDFLYDFIAKHRTKININ